MDADLKRLLSKVEKSDKTGCWQWIAGKVPAGYGNFWFRGTTRRAHRASYELHYGPIPVGYCVCHRCDNPSCVNPDHLFLGSQDENMADMVAKGRQSRLNGRGLPQTKLSEQEVLAIRASAESCRHLSKKYGVGPMQISRIRARKRWAHIG